MFVSRAWKEFCGHLTPSKTFTWLKGQDGLNEMIRWSVCASPQRDPKKRAQRTASVGELASYVVSLYCVFLGVSAV